ncbi:MAG: c-type cytochrome [Myxococcota bacterium]
MHSLKSWVIAMATLPLVAVGCDYATAKTDPDEPTADMAERGEAHYVNYCLQCHGENGAGNPDIGAPSIGGLPYWYVAQQLYNFRNGIRGVAYDDIAGKRMRPMAWALPSDRQLREVAAYVDGIQDDVGEIVGLQSVKTVTTIQATAEELAAGKASYLVCTACHGANGMGNPDLHSPKLVHLPDWYIVTQLKNFKSGARGRHPDDQWGQTMWPNAIALEEQDMENLAAYIQTLKSGN